MKNKDFVTFLSVLLLLSVWINYSNADLNVWSDWTVNINSSDWTSMTVWSGWTINMNSPDTVKKNIVNFDKDQKNIKEFMNSLENEIKTLREAINKENIEEIKVKAEELKNKYLEKVKSINPDLQKMVNERFDIFFKNQFILREELTNLKKDFDVKKEDFKKDLNVKKEDFKKETEVLKENLKIKKDEIKNNVSDLRKNLKQTKEDLKVKYKEEFKVQLANRLESLSKENLQKVLSKIETQISKIVDSNISNTSKEKILAQLYAIKEIISEKLWTDVEEELNLDELLNVE